MANHRSAIPRTGRDLVVELLPLCFRIQSITRLPLDALNTMNRATLFHEQAVLTVEWPSRQVDTRLAVGALVAIRWLGRPVCNGGAVRISRIVALERPLPALNLFDTVPHGWVNQRLLLRRATAMWNALSRPMQHLFNAVMWDGGRFRRYLVGPSSVSGHHNSQNGNLTHCIEVAERAVALAGSEKLACPDVLIAAALLHDAGKADEYCRINGRLQLTPRGKLVGHRHTIIEWIAAARAQPSVVVPEWHYLALIHALTCAKGAPPWLGLREPQSIDAAILSVADRLSGQSELMERHASPWSGFGRSHKHLGGPPFVVHGRRANGDE